MGEKETTHENIESAVETEEPVAKKARFFAPKSFRKQLHTEEKTSGNPVNSSVTCTYVMSF